MKQVVRIGAATAFYNDSRMGIAQLLEKGGPIDYIIFDFLAESVMARLSRDDGGYAGAFIDGYILPHLHRLLERGVRVVANAGGLAPQACADALRVKAAAIGLHPRIGVVSGDNLTDRIDAIVDADTRDMFDGAAVRDRIRSADRIDSLVAYTGAFPIAAALGAGADIVVTGRAVDSALALGALIHEFGWTPGDYDRLAAGTLAGHLLECSAQVTGGTFTDWRDVPDWAGIGMPIGECRADGSMVLTKPEGTGGLVSVGTVAEQLLYEVSDPQHYFVADVVADFSDVRLEQVGADRVSVSGARGLGRTGTYKASLTYDEGWRAQALFPVIGHEAGEKAARTGEALLKRTGDMLARAQMPPYSRQRCDVVGGEGDGATTAICRIVVDHPDKAGADLMVYEHSAAISHMSVGISATLGAATRPVQRIAGFLLPKSAVSLEVSVDGAPVPVTIETAATDDDVRPAPPPLPAPPGDADPALTVPLIRLAWARSGDKGNLFNVAFIARRPDFLPYIAAALSPEAVGAHYGRVIGDGTPYAAEAYSAPGFHALNFVVGGSMEGGVMSTLRIDAVAKGMAQRILDFPVPVSAALFAALNGNRG